METQSARQQQREIQLDEGQNGWSCLSDVLAFDCFDPFCKDPCELLRLKGTYGHTQEKGVCVKCTPFWLHEWFRSSLVQIAPWFGCISASTSCLRACFFCYGTFEYACYNMSDYRVNGKEKEMGHAF